MALPLCRVYGYLLITASVGIALILLIQGPLQMSEIQRRWSLINEDNTDVIPQGIIRAQPSVVCTIDTTRDPLTSTTDPNQLVQTEQQQKHQGPLPVMILTYMRSGSSFTGQILQAALSAFYWFEPMHKLFRNFTTKKTFHFLNGENREFSIREDAASFTARAIFSCKLTGLPLDVLTDGFLTHGNEKTSHQLMSCLASFRRLSSEPSMALRRCIPDYEMICNNSKHVVIKTIRMRMSSMERLLVNFPRLKVIHLMRDPRGTVRSQKRYGGFTHSSNDTESVENFCRTVLRDVLDREDLQRRFPNRIMSVFYEDIAKHPITSSKELYSFLGMNYTSESEKEILHMTSSGIAEKNCGALCTNRSNSSQEAYEWRHEISIGFVKKVDKVCVDLYNKVGYNTIPNKTVLQDLQYQLRNNN